MATGTANPWLHIVTLFGLPIAGYAIGLGLASWSAPGSGFAAALSGMLLPTAFAAGLILWAGLSAVLGVFAVLRHGRRAAPRHDLGRRSGRWFVPIAAAVAGAGGLLVGALPGGAGILPTMALYTSAGVAYGWFISWLAATGGLPAPHD
jgi:hypothetical protein